MKRKKTVPLVISILLFVLLLFGFYYLLKPTPIAKTFSKNDAVKMVQHLYGGKIISTDVTEEEFIIKNEQDKGIYEIIINKQSGNVQKVDLIKDNPSKDPSVAIEKQTILQEKDVQLLIKGQSSGQIDSVKLIQNDNGKSIYIVQVTEKNQVLTYKMDASTGAILGKNVETGDKQSKDGNEKKGTDRGKISEAEAIKIATDYLAGKVDNVDFEDEDDGVYYIVEIETNDDEAEIQIDAITGEILSVTWDD